MLTEKMIDEDLKMLLNRQREKNPKAIKKLERRINGTLKRTKRNTYNRYK